MDLLSPCRLGGILVDLHGWQGGDHPGPRAPQLDQFSPVIALLHLCGLMLTGSPSDVNVGVGVEFSDRESWCCQVSGFFAELMQA